MFLSIIFIVLGLILLLNAMGIIISSNFWGFFWAIVFLALGVQLLIKKGRCPMCGWGHFEGSMHEKIHERMRGQCCGHNHENEE